VKFDRVFRLKPVRGVDEIKSGIKGKKALKVVVEVVLFGAKFSLRVYVGVVIVMREEDTRSVKLVKIPL